MKNQFAVSLVLGLIASVSAFAQGSPLSGRYVLDLNNPHCTLFGVKLGSALEIMATPAELTIARPGRYGGREVLFPVTGYIVQDRTTKTLGNGFVRRVGRYENRGNTFTYSQGIAQTPGELRDLQPSVQITVTPKGARFTGFTRGQIFEECNLTALPRL